MSTSFISSFKACPMRCKLKYVLGLVPIEDTDALRTGTNWHRLLEIMGMKPGTVCPECSKAKNNPECPLCEGTDILAAEMMDAVVRQLNKSYETVPMSKTKQEWLTERAILLYSIAGYNWRYVDDDFEVVAEELEFSLPLRNPESGRALPNVVLKGKIDKIVRSPQGIYYVDEHKSTGSSVDSDSTYWSKLNLDTQTRLYVYAARQLQLTGALEVHGIKPDDPLISGVRYDVWHKPGIRPKKLTQADSKKFVETGEYMGDKFEVKRTMDNEFWEVNGEIAETEPGKKEGIFTIKETPDMFGARLLIDIGERPEFYFARREISRTDADMAKFEREIYSIYKSVRFIDKIDGWWPDESQCEATFRCPYTSLCYNNVDLSDGRTPDGFKSIFKDKENETP